jgi:hypothetical protein
MTARTGPKAAIELESCPANIKVHFSAGGRSMVIDREKGCSVGRTRYCDIYVEAESVAELVASLPGWGGTRNLIFECSDNTWRVVHCMHHGWIHVNGEPLTRGDRILKDGDLIEPGQGLRLRFRVIGEDEA